MVNLVGWRQPPLALAIDAERMLREVRQSRPSPPRIVERVPLLRTRRALAGVLPARHPLTAAAAALRGEGHRRYRVGPRHRQL